MSRVERYSVSPAGTWGRGRAALAVAALAAIAFVANFWNFRDFGIYEDDTRAIAPYLGAPFSVCWNQCLSAFANWPQGRPLNHSLPEFFAWLGSSLCGGRLWGIYLIAWLVLVVNAALVRTLALTFVSPLAAFVGAAVYLLVPFDTTRQFLTHSGHLHTSLTFFLLGAVLYVRGGNFRIAAYFAGSLCLVTYESPFLLFLYFPVILWAVGRLAFSQLLAHGVICGTLMVGAGALRWWQGESRVEASTGDIGISIWQMFSSLGIGPMTSLTRMVMFLTDIPPFTPPLLAVTSAVAALVVFGIVNSRSTGPLFDGFPWGRLILACAGWLAFSYALSLVAYPPTQILGRRTTLHLSASIPMALAAACLFQAGWNWRPFRGAEIFLAVFAALYLGLLASFQYRVQIGYIEAWSAARGFWREMLILCPDLGPDTTVVVAGRMRPNPTKVIKSFDVSNQRFLSLLFDATGAQPRMIWAAALDKKGAVFGREKNADAKVWAASLGKQKVSIKLSDIIVLRNEGDRLIRDRSVTLKSGAVLFGKSLVKSGSVLEGRETTLFRLVTGETSLARYCRQGRHPSKRGGTESAKSVLLQE